MTDNEHSILSSNLFFLSSALARRLTTEANEQFAQFGLSGSHALLLILIDDRPNIQPSHLAQKLVLKPSTITRLVNKLERRKLIVRNSKGRSSHITCTSKGKELVTALHQKWNELIDTKKQELGDRYTSVLTELMQDTLQNVISD